MLNFFFDFFFFFLRVDGYLNSILNKRHFLNTKKLLYFYKHLMRLDNTLYTFSIKLSFSNIGQDKTRNK